MKAFFDAIINHIMTLQSDIRADMMAAMKERNTEKTTLLKSLISGFTNELVSLGRTPQDVLTDEEAMNVIKRAEKQRKDSIKQFEDGGRPELAATEKVELEFLTAYLPEMMRVDQITEIAKKVKEEMGIDDKSKMGVLIGAVVKATEGKADGGDIKDVVISLFDN